MKVLCPQCGRKFDVPEAQASRLVKCICKHIFAVSEHKAEQDPHETAPSQLHKNMDQADTHISFKSSIKDAEINSFIDDLKKSRASSPKEKITDSLQNQLQVQRALCVSTHHALYFSKEGAAS